MTGTTESIQQILEHLPKRPEAGEGLLLGIFTVYQAYFHRLHSRVKRLTDTLQT
jgi:hypothetical protein